MMFLPLTANSNSVFPTDGTIETWDLWLSSVRRMTSIPSIVSRWAPEFGGLCHKRDGNGQNCGKQCGFHDFSALSGSIRSSAVSSRQHQQMPGVYVRMAQTSHQ